MLRLRSLQTAVSCCRMCLRSLADDKRWMATEEEMENFARKTMTKGEALTHGALSPQFYHTTLDDNYQRTTIRTVNEDKTGSYVSVGSYSKFGFRLSNGTQLCGPVALFPKVALSWMVPSVDHITEESVEFFALLEPKLDVLILGVGDDKNLEPVRRRLMPFFKKHRVNVEILTTMHACATFNYLNDERRCVAAALFPPDDIQPTTQESMNLDRNYSDFGQIPFADDKDYLGVPLVPGTESSLHALKKLYENRKKRLEAEDKELAKQIGNEKPDEKT